MPTPDPKEIFSRRLLQARKMRGLSLRALSEKLEGQQVSHSALAKYEKGQMMPSSGVLIALAHALVLKPGYFLRSFEVDLADVAFRKRSKLGKKEKASIIEESRDYFERYLELEEILGIRDAFVNPLAGPPISTEDQAEEKAIALRKEWRLGMDALPNICELLEEHDIKVYIAESEDRAFDGMCGRADGNRVIVLAKWLLDHPARERNTLTHELAHIVIETDLPEREAEKLMNRFAGAFLMPAQAVKELFGGNREQVSLPELIEMKALYGISIMAIVMRAHQRGYLSDQSLKRFFMQANQNHWREGEPGDERVRGPEIPSRFRVLAYRALSEERITMSKAAELLQTSINEIRDNFMIVT